MVGNRQAGFTIVEITLFMAITGLLFLVALVGTGNTIRTFRFTDTARSLEAFSQKQYDDIINGLNNRSADVSCNAGAINTGAGQEVGSSNCLLIGKLLVFRQNSGAVNVYNVIGSEPASVNYAQSDNELISAFSPTTVTATATSTYNLPWGAQMSGFKRTSDNNAANGLLLIRSPKSSRIVSYTFKVPAAVPTSLSPYVNDANNLLKTTNFCFKDAEGNGQQAHLRITNAPNQEAAKVLFNTPNTECNGV